MNKKAPKKTLVRNTELPLPKTRFIVEDRSKRSERTTMDAKPKGAERRSKFHSPELNSTLKISEKIDKVAKAKSQTFEAKKDVAFCEKVTRKMNFPVDKAIYKDLMPLDVPVRSPPILSSRDPLPLKDKEPSLCDYAKPLQPQEYISIPSLKSERHSVIPQLSCLRMYKLLQINS